MSIKLLTPYGRYPINAIVSTLGAATEAALVGDKLATTNLAGGVPWAEPSAAQDARPIVGSPADQAAFQALVSGGGKYPAVASGAPAAASNYTALAAALAAPGNVIIPPAQGDIFISRTLEVGSNSGLEIGAGSYIKRSSGAQMFPLVRNIGSQNGIYCIGIGSIPPITVSGGIVTIYEPGHPWGVGDSVYVEQMLGNTTLNGHKTVISSVPGVSWTYAGTGAVPSNGQQVLAYTSRSNPKAGSIFTRAANVVTVQEPGHSRGVGDRVLVLGLGGTNSFNGVAEITNAVDGVSWAYANTGANEAATGTGQLLGDRAITLRYALDGNSQNCIYNGQWNAHLSNWGNISKLTETILDSKNGVGGRVSNHYNAVDVVVPFARSSAKVAVLMQFDSYCDRVFPGVLDGQDCSDDVLAWGTTSAAGAFADTTQPCGPGNMGVLDVKSIGGESATGIFKCYATTGTDLGRIKIGTITGKGPVSIGDPTVGVMGGTVTSLVIGDIDTIPFANGHQVVFGTNSFSSLKEVRIGRLSDNAQSTTTTGTALNIGQAIDSVQIDTLVCPVARVNTYSVLIGGAIKSFRVGSQFSTTGSGSSVFLAAAGVVDSLFIDSLHHIGPSATEGLVLCEQAGGTFKNIYIGKGLVKSAKGLYGSNTAGLTHNLYLSNLQLESVGQGIGSDVTGTFNVFLSNVNCVSTNNNLFQFYLAGVVARIVGAGVRAPAGQFCLFTSTTQIGIDSKDFRLDLGANGAAPPSQLAPIAGDLVYNTNATGAGVYGRTAAGAWAKVY